jgi:hypothetical protein
MFLKQVSCTTVEVEPRRRHAFAAELESCRRHSKNVANVAQGRVGQKVPYLKSQTEFGQI